MKKSLVVLLSLLTIVSAEAQRVGAGTAVSREAPPSYPSEVRVTVEGTSTDGSYKSEGVKAGRYSFGTVEATGPNGGLYNATTTTTGEVSTTTVETQTPAGVTTTTTRSSYNGYRSGYVYRGGEYQAADITMNAPYEAPMGAYTGLSVTTRPDYVAYPMYATYPVEVAVQVEMKRLGFYTGEVDGTVGPQLQKAISKYQAQNGLPATGKIDRALLDSLRIS